jgi:membrane-associated protease RseP (regulator of RpoE activity)
MSEQPQLTDQNNIRNIPKRKKIISLWIYIFLFIVTFFSTAIAGAQWAGVDYLNLLNWYHGITYAVLIMIFLSAHEFGHYIASRIHKIDATLPYFLPMPIVYISPFGTFGAVIKTRTPILTRKALFDIGAAGPIAGFFVSLGFLIYGLMTLPGIDFIYKIHPHYLTEFGGKIPHTSLFFGDTLLYSFLAKIFANPSGFLPPMNEIYHYPYLNVGWFGLFVTSINLLPMGQLDGGHITYAMFGGKIQSKIAKISWWALIFICSGAALNFLYDILKVDNPGSIYNFLQSALLPTLKWLKEYAPWYMAGWGGWLLWVIIAKIFIKLNHPIVADNEKLDTKRMAIGWFAILIFFLSFSYNGIYFIE